MRHSRWAVISFGILAVAMVGHAPGCSIDCADNLTCGEPPKPIVEDLASCIPRKQQEDNQTAVKDECGVFVRLGGDDMAVGTKGKPFATIARAIEVATASKSHRIYACAEIFPEALEIHSGIEIFGGLNCAGGAWQYSSSKRTVIAPEASKIPMKFIKDNETPIHIEDVDAHAADATMPGGSSIAATADAVALELVRSDLVAGSGASGDNGLTPLEEVLPTSSDDPQIIGKVGNNACMGGAQGNPGAEEVMNPFCPESISGRGGKGQETVGESGEDGVPVNPADPTFGIGGAGSSGVGCLAGGQGALGLFGTPGASADDSAGLGSFALGGYTGVDGTPGLDGKAGQGGGGGGGEKGKVFPSCYGASGGSGGAGGCGGKGGTAGKSGGSSIALISLGAKLSFTDVELIAGSGGNGGDGGEGQFGGVGGYGGKGGLPGSSGTVVACAGGDGGEGGKGGKGGGGRGGHAVGIVFSKGAPPPELPMGSITVGKAGIGGAGEASSGADGLAQERLQLP